VSPTTVDPTHVPTGDEQDEQEEGMSPPVHGHDAPAGRKQIIDTGGDPSGPGGGYDLNTSFKRNSEEEEEEEIIGARARRVSQSKLIRLHDKRVLMLCHKDWF
jgi:hypothetical protein